MRINDLSSLSLIEYHYLHKSHLFVPLSVYDVMTALLFACFLAFHLLHQRPGESIRIRTVSLDMEEIPNVGIVAGRSSLGWLHILLGRGKNWAAYGRSVVVYRTLISLASSHSLAR
jgi:hypothetical protein